LHSSNAWFIINSIEEGAAMLCDICNKEIVTRCESAKDPDIMLCSWWCLIKSIEIKMEVQKMSASKRKEKKRMENGWYRAYRFFFPADWKASFERGQMQGEEWKRQRTEEVKRGIEITATKHSWLTKLPFFGVFFKKIDEEK